MNNYGNEEENSQWYIPRPYSNEKLFGKMSGIAEIVIFPSKSNDKVDSSSYKCQVNFIKKNSWLFGRFQRKLVNESLGTFLSIQNCSDADKKKNLIKKSREYRSMVQACVAEMNQVLEVIEAGQVLPFEENADELKVNCELLYKMELVLGLIEIIFIDKQPGGIILNQLMNWIRLHFPSCRQKMSECLSSDQPSEHNLYWEACFGLVLQGLMNEARELLSRHPDSNMECFLSMDEVLKKMPTHMVYSGVSEAEFLVRWQHWQSECESRLSNGEFSEVEELQTICKILCGDQETLYSLTSLMDTWYHLMTSKLLFTNPSVKLHRLGAAAQEAIYDMGVEASISSLDQLIMAIFEDNDHKVLELIQSVLDNLWFCAHVADLFYQSSEQNENRYYLKDIRESVIIDYGSELCTHESLWQLGLMYLDLCGSETAHATAIVETVLQRVPLKDDNMALKVIQCATQRNMDDVVVSVCRVMGRKALQQSQLGSAIWWGVRSKDAAFTSHLAHKILQRYMETGEFESCTLLDHLGPSMLLSDTLTFLTKYREFHLLYQEGDLKAAAFLLVSLIASRLAPEYFWPILLEDSLPLLQTSVPVISADQTYKLIYCLHNLSTKFKEDNEKAMYVSFMDKEKDIRLALTSNLARAIIEEGTVDV